MTRPWWREAVFYQIYPRSFVDSNGDGVGDLRGITSRLDYLRGTSASLGIDAIWLAPFYPSPMADFGYDVADHCNVDPIFGTLADFDELLNEAHRRDMRLIVDLVPNHTSDQHPWFRESSSSSDNAKRDWYVWRKSSGRPPNNWMSEFRGAGAAWTFDPTTDAWYLHSFLPSQPDLNWDNPDVERAIHDVMRFWLSRGVDGFRIDVVHKIGKAPDLRDNLGMFAGPGLGDRGRRFDEDWPAAHDRVRRMRAVARSFGDRVLVGEVYLLDQSQLAPYVRTGRELDLAHNFHFLTLPWHAEAFAEAVTEFELLIAPRGWPTWCLNNHDHSRVASRYPGEPAARVAAMLLLTLRGTPFIYQGEELGLGDGIVSTEAVVDIDGRDPERCPIPWENPAVAGPGAGFTTGTPWLPLPPDAGHHNATDALAEPTSLLTLYRHLMELRRSSPALRAGSFTKIQTDHRDVFAYRRTAGRESLTIALNFGETRTRVPARGSIVASTSMTGCGNPVTGSIEVPPLSGFTVRET